MSDTKSIVLVTVDCLRADHVGFLGYQKPTTPFLDTLAGESFVIPTAIVAGTPTYYSLPAIHASRYPLALGRDVLGLAPEEATFALTLQHAGYSTAAFVAGNPYLSVRFGYDQGFDVFDDFAPKQSAAAKNGAGRGSWLKPVKQALRKLRPTRGPLSALYDELYFEYCQRKTPVPHSLDALRQFPAADVLVDRACQWLKSVDDAPFFLWLHLMDPHAPFYPKPDALERMGSKTPTPFEARYSNSYWYRSDIGARRLSRRKDEIVTLYDACIRWVDVQVSRLVDTLNTLNRWNDCVFALTADHGEEFLEHGERLHAPSGLAEELIHVPLLLRVPGTSGGAASNAPFSLIHLAPTLLDAADIPSPTTFRGSSQWSALRRGDDFQGVAISECVEDCTNPLRTENRFGARILSVRDSRHKLVIHFDPWQERLFDLMNDPLELKSLAESLEKPVRRRLVQAALAHLRQGRLLRPWRARAKARLNDLRIEWQTSALNSSQAGSNPANG